MTLIKLHTLLTDAQECNTLDEYIAECGGSVPAEYADDTGDPTAAIDLLTTLWQFRDGINFRQLREFSGLRIAEFSRDYGIPIRTIEQWDAETRKPPAYLLELLLCDILNSQKAEG